MVRPARVAALVSALAILWSCAESPTASRFGDGPASVISDGAHMHGNPHFYFLPPMVSQPAFSGTSDGSLSPLVSVCEMAGTACTRTIATFTTTSGTGSEVVRYDGSSQYVVNWHTDQCITGPCTLDPAKTYRIRIFVGLAELGFADVDVVSNGSQLRNVQTDEYIGLVDGRTLPVKFRIEQGAVSVVAAGGSVSIGSAGGLVASSDGSTTLAIPAGALASATAITVAPPDVTPDGAQPWAPVVELGPTGTAFTTPLTLTLSYDPHALPAGAPDSAVAIIYLRDGSWDVVPGSVVNAADHSVSAPISHFSSYSIGLVPSNASFVSQPTTVSVGQTTTLRASLSVTTCGFFSCTTSPVVNWWVYWDVSAAAVSRDVSQSKTDVNGNATARFTGLQPGSVAERAYYLGNFGTHVYSGPIQLTVVPPLVMLVGHGSTGGQVPDTLRQIGVNQAFGIYLRIPTAQASPMTVTFSHRSSVLSMTPAATIPAGATFAPGATVIGQSRGTDTIIATAPNYGPDTVVVAVDTGRLRVAGWPATLNFGDSAALRIEPLDPTGHFNDGGYGLTYTLSASNNLRFSDGHNVITTVRVPDATYSTPTFYATAVGSGAASLVVSEPGSHPDTVGIAINAQLLALLPGNTTIPARLGRGEQISIPAALASPLAVSITNKNGLVIYEAGTANTVYGGQTGTFVVPVGATTKGMNLYGSVGTDTIIAAAPGYLTDTAIVRVVPATLKVTGLPTTLAYGDSALVQVAVADQNGVLGTVGYAVTFSLGSSGGLVFSNGTSPITTFDIQFDKTQFYVKAVAAGTPTMTITNPDFVTYSTSTSVAQPPSISPSPTSVTISVAQGSVGQATININNGGGGTLSGLFVGPFSDYFSGGQYPWMKASFSSTTAPSVMTITAAPPIGQPIQQYQIRVSLVAPGAVPSSFTFFSIFVNVLPAATGAEAMAGGKSSCEKRLDGTVICWGETSYGATAAPDGAFQTISGGFFHYCGIRTDQSLTCWGYDSDLRAEPPAGTFRELSVGPEDACALRTDNTAACWGFTNDGRASPPAGSWWRISVGWYHGCGIRNDGTPVCWGRNDVGQATPPAGELFREVQGGVNTTCGIHLDLTLACWGAITTAPSGDFIAIGHNVGGGHMCAIRTDRTLACWGQNDFGQANPPAGQFLQVSEGALHSCGVRIDGSVACWGSDATGALDFPVCVAPLPSLTHWWPGESSATDIIGGDNGAVNGSVQYASGRVGRAFQFGNGFLQLAQNYGGPGTSEVTVMAWIQVQQSGPEAWQAILSSTTSSFLHFQTSTVGGAAVYTDPSSGGFNQIASFAPSPLATWRHVALTAKPGDIRIYENGSVISQSSAPYSYITQQDEAVLIGRGYGFGRPFPGLIDELQVYNRALTPGEIQAIVNAGSAGVCQP